MSEIADLEAGLMESPSIRVEVERLGPILRKMRLDQFVALDIALRREAVRRTEPLSRPVRIGNR